MSKRKGSGNGLQNGGQESLAPAAALQQYQDTEGHFSLVRYVALLIDSSLLFFRSLRQRILVAMPLSLLSMLQEFPTGGPRHHC